MLPARSFMHGNRQIAVNCATERLQRQRPGILPRIIEFYGTESRTRTDTVSPPPDFESGASTNSAIPAMT
jgi:hypothetical protein